MIPIQSYLERKFGWRNVNFSTSLEEFDIKQTGKDFFLLNKNKNIQFYVFDYKMISINQMAFTKTTEQSFARVIALDYFLSEKYNIPEYLVVCISKEKRKLDCILYNLREKQIEQIRKEYNSLE
jgi:hypothetical protein